MSQAIPLQDINFSVISCQFYSQRIPFLVIHHKIRFLFSGFCMFKSIEFYFVNRTQTQARRYSAGLPNYLIC